MSRSDKMKARWQDPEFVAKMKRPKTEEEKKKISDSMLKTLRGEKSKKIKKKRSHSQKKYYKSLTKEQRREKMKNAIAASKSPEALKKLSETMKKKWAEIPKTERRKRVRPWIDGGQKARKTEGQSSLEILVQDALNYFEVDYEPHPIIEGYSVDFLAKPKTVIEVDGYYHTRQDIKKRDAERDKTLKAAGYEVKRITEAQIVDNVYIAVAEALGIELK